MIAVDTDLLVYAHRRDAPFHEAAVRTVRTLAEAPDASAASPSLQLIGEMGDQLARLRGIVEAAGVGGAEIHDARVAAVSIAHGVSQLLTLDRDFGRFPSLRTSNPLV